MSFAKGQREVIGAILSGKDVAVVMPTGSGKSLYQLPAMMLSGATLVVSPLIALQSINFSLFAVDEAHCISTWATIFGPITCA